MAETRAELLARAVQIRDEFRTNANTASRVGGALYELADSAALIPVDVSEAANVTGLPYFDVRHYGTLTSNSSGAADANAATIQAALLAAHTAGGGRALVPPGVFYTGATGPVIDGYENVSLEGAGVGCTTLYLADGADDNVLEITGASVNIAVRHMTLDGNRANQTTSVHGIRVASCDGLWIENCEIVNASHYGIGMQSETKRFVFLSNLIVRNSGGDGIDIKNTDDDNAFCVANNILIENFGLNLAQTTQAGFDVRGPWQIDNIVVRGASSDGSCIRFRPGELLDSNGLGGHRSHLSNFECYGPSGGTGFGVEINARDVAVSQGYVYGVFRGVQSDEDRVRVTSVTCEGCTDGFALGSNADDNTLDKCTSISNTGKGVRISGGDRNQLTGCVITGNTGEGILISAGSDLTLIANCYLTGNSAALNDVGTSTRLRDNVGLGGLVGVSISEDVLSAATSAVISIPISGSTTYTFRVQARSENAGGTRATVRSLVETMRSGSSGPTTPTVVSELTAGAGLTLNVTLSGNNLRFSVTNGSGSDAHITTRVWELDREPTVEDS
jgi:parallel beta-helix repeat protein